MTYYHVFLRGVTQRINLWFRHAGGRARGQAIPVLVAIAVRGGIGGVRVRTSGPTCKRRIIMYFRQGDAEGRYYVSTARVRQTERAQVTDRLVSRTRSDYTRHQRPRREYVA